jgi:hypothetical protein
MKVFTEEKEKEVAEALYKVGQGKFGTNEKGLFKILSASKAPQELESRVRRKIWLYSYQALGD